MSPEEMEGYGSPSIMDDYIKENDPEQWEKIRNARSVQDAINLGLGTAGAMKLPGKGLMGKFGPVRKSIGEAKGKLPKEIYNKAIGHLTQEKPNFGKVTASKLPKENCLLKEEKWQNELKKWRIRLIPMSVFNV